MPNQAAALCALIFSFFHLTTRLEQFSVCFFFDFFFCFSLFYFYFLTLFFFLWFIYPESRLCVYGCGRFVGLSVLA